MPHKAQWLLILLACSKPSSSVAQEYVGGWTIRDSEELYLGAYQSPRKPLLLENASFKQRKSTLTSWAGDLGIITATIATAIVFLTVQVGLHQACPNTCLNIGLYNI